MTNGPTQFDLHRSIATLLESRTTGNAVAQELNARYQAWQTRAAIADLRARRVQNHNERDRNTLFPVDRGAPH